MPGKKKRRGRPPKGASGTRVLKMPSVIGQSNLRRGRRALGFPRNKSVTLRYNACVVVDPAAGGIATYQFRLNSINDPDLTGTGHQPMGHDQWAQYYNHYVVLSTKFNIKAGSGAPGIPMIYGYHISDDSSVPATLQEFAEQGLGNYAMHTAGGEAIELKGSWAAKKFFNVVDVKDNDDLGALFNTNPAEEGILTLYTGSCDANENPPKQNFFVTIDYRVSLAEPKDLPGS